MKIHLELVDEDEPEIIIKCRELTPDIIRLQQLITGFDAKSNQMIFYKGDTEYYVNQKILPYMHTRQQTLTKPNTNCMNLKKFFLHHL